MDKDSLLRMCLYHIAFTFDYDEEKFSNVPEEYVDFAESFVDSFTDDGILDAMGIRHVFENLFRDKYWKRIKKYLKKKHDKTYAMSPLERAPQERMYFVSENSSGVSIDGRYYWMKFYGEFRDSTKRNPIYHRKEDLLSGKISWFEEVYIVWDEAAELERRKKEDE